MNTHKNFFLLLRSSKDSSINRIFRFSWMEYQLVSNIEIIIVLYFSFDFKIASQTNRKQYLFAQNSYQTLKVHTHYTHLRTSFFAVP